MCSLGDDIRIVEMNFIFHQVPDHPFIAVDFLEMESGLEVAIDFWPLALILGDTRWRFGRGYGLSLSSGASLLEELDDEVVFEKDPFVEKKRRSIHHFVGGDGSLLSACAQRFRRGCDRRCCRNRRSPSGG